MAKYLPVCGKNPSDLATPVEVTANGELKNVHIWETNKTALLSAEEIRNTTAVVTNVVDVSDYAITSLRVYNSLDANVVINFYEDATNGMGYWLADKDNLPVGITLAHGTYYMAITPDDIPQLNYLSKIKLRVAAATTPTEGSLTIYVVSKR